jgi:SAM-dependent methyltransferase
MSLAYRILYGVGFTPWEQMAQPPIADQIGDFFAREEAGREPPQRLALDLGCGSGIWAVVLARRGWQVTGVDFVPKALRRARARADEARVELRLVEGDVTDLSVIGVGSSFDLLVDFGCFHDELTDEQRRAEGREATAAAPDATLLLMAWKPGRRGPLPRGASSEDIEAAFTEWRLVDDVKMDLPSRAPGYVKGPSRGSIACGGGESIWFSARGLRLPLAGRGNRARHLGIGTSRGGSRSHG